MKTDETTTDAPATAVAKGKSIIDPKYRGKYKTPDWLAQLLLDNTSNTKVIPAKEARDAVGKIGEEGHKPAQVAAPERTVNDGVNTDKLFKLANENGLNTTKFEAQKGSHGFEGRIRMTIRNMLQSVVKQRHGLVLNGTFVPAPQDFLTKAGILEGAKPTYTPEGVKIAKVKADAPAEDAKPAPESKLIKKEDAPAKAVAKAVAKPKK